jgi:hypothetical protein
MRWERTFEVSLPVERAWAAFLETERPEPWNRALTADAYYAGGGIEVEVEEEQPGERLRWSETAGDDRVEMEVTFTAVDTGTSITITRSGFGGGDAWLGLHSARWLGWVQAMHDYALSAEHGVEPVRHFRWRTDSGMLVVEAAAGLRVVAVDRGGWAESAGLQPGDVLLAIAGAPVYELSDLWTLHGVLEPERVVSVDAVRGGVAVAGEAPIPSFAGWGS